MNLLCFVLFSARSGGRGRGDPAFHPLLCQPCFANPALPTLLCQPFCANPALPTLLCRPCFANPALPTLLCQPCFANPALRTLLCEPCFVNPLLSLLAIRGLRNPAERANKNENKSIRATGLPTLCQPFANPFANPCQPFANPVANPNSLRTASA